ncbi:MAG: ABC transporter permease [Roseiflexaceae bacterium]|nr:ABC transporter permease [Roseiflexaceae bacterium]
MKHVLQRIVWLPLVLWAVVTLTFLVLRLAPGNPLDVIAARAIETDQIERVRAEWGLDQPLWRQYLTFLGGLVQGDLGIALSSGVPVSRLLGERIAPTIELAVSALIISTVVGVGAGVISSITRQRWVDYGVRAFAVVGMSVPWFWVAILLIIVFSVRLGWTPVGGRITAGMPYTTLTNFMLIDTVLTGNWPAFWSFLHHLALPALAIGLTSAGFVARMTRAAMLEIMRADYVRAARARGLYERRIVIGHALRNALLPVLTLQGLQFGALLGGAVITEIVFAWPGVGRMLLDGILRRDYPIVQGTVIFVAFCYVLVNLAVDLLYHVVDPRLRRA